MLHKADKESVEAVGNRMASQVCKTNKRHIQMISSEVIRSWQKGLI